MALNVDCIRLDMLSTAMILAMNPADNEGVIVYNEETKSFWGCDRIKWQEFEWKV